MDRALPMPMPSRREHVERHLTSGPPLEAAPAVPREDVTIIVEERPRAQDPARR